MICALLYYSQQSTCWNLTKKFLLLSPHSKYSFPSYLLFFSTQLLSYFTPFLNSCQLPLLNLWKKTWIIVNFWHSNFAFKNLRITCCYLRNMILNTSLLHRKNQKDLKNYLSIRRFFQNFSLFVWCTFARRYMDHDHFFIPRMYFAINNFIVVCHSKQLATM